MTLRVPLSPELRRWILGYGKDVEVLEPKSLREDIRREWLAALRGREGRVEPLRLGVKKPRRRSGAGRAPAVVGGSQARARQAAIRPQRKT
jgi:hypothetical protein